MFALIKTLLSNQIIQAIFFLGLLWILWDIRYILATVFIAFIISSAFYPARMFLERRHIPKWIAVITPYIFLAGILILLVLPLIPFAISQTQEFIANTPSYLHTITKFSGVKIDVNDIRNLLGSRIEAIGTNVFSITTDVFGKLITIFITLFISIYLLADRERLQATVSKLFKERKKTTQLWEKVENTLGAWARGQVVLSFSIGIANYIAYLFLGISYALPLAIFAGIMEAVPTIGPVIAAIPAVLIALTISPTKAFFVVIAYVLIQLLEGNFLVPKIMQQAVGLHPIVVILAILIGDTLMGMPGALIAIPFVALISAILETVRESSY